ncbi:unnamed protein product, partial [Mesorhabditis spiculigera]
MDALFSMAGFLGMAYLIYLSHLRIKELGGTTGAPVVGPLIDRVAAVFRRKKAGSPDVRTAVGTTTCKPITSIKSNCPTSTLRTQQPANEEEIVKSTTSDAPGSTYNPYSRITMRGLNGSRSRSRSRSRSKTPHHAAHQMKTLVEPTGH